MAREALGIVGAAVGYVASGGNPLGAQIGFAIGAGIGGYVDPVRVPHPGLSDAPIQTSRDGVPIPIIHGLHYVHGNLIQKNPEEIVTTTTRQGKGGSTEVEEKTRYRTFAIGICEAPISGIRRIWENNKLVYDTRSSPAIPIAESTKFAEGFTLYNGEESQLPDSELEAHWTADETPAYRGLAYIVFTNKDLTPFGGAIPNYAFEVNGSADATITSKPYPVEGIEGITGSPTPARTRQMSPPLEGVDASVSLTDITLNTLLESYSFEVEGIDPTLALSSITLTDALEQYTYDIEGVDPTVSLTDITLDPRLVQHTYEPEGVDPSLSITSVTLT